MTSLVSPTPSPPPPSGAAPHHHPPENDGRFDCNICLGPVSEPVVTTCGHLYCWTCLYTWTRRVPSCPVCKAGCDAKGGDVVPLYVRGEVGDGGRRGAGTAPDDDGAGAGPRRRHRRR
mmetsp:Transcript_7592/g.15770  ORF Transcript_7592/g.15770 Transcript_7592/m.15770 type:complete len:118 (+) Transcript_7592:231-584(+)